MKIIMEAGIYSRIFFFSFLSFLLFGVGAGGGFSSLNFPAYITTAFLRIFGVFVFEVKSVQ